MDEKYLERYCACDILGFREMINDLDKRALSVDEMRALLSFIHRPIGMSTNLWPTGFRAQSISDAVAISTNVNYAGLYEMLRALEGLTVQLLERGFFIRGGLVKGPLFHDENMVFGRALVDAFRLESEFAKYPRVMATREVWLDFEKYREQQKEPIIFDNWMQQADDGPMFVHTLRGLEKFAYQTKLENVNRRMADQNSLGNITALKKIIQEKLNLSIDNPRHFEKVQWFASYWNQSIPYGGDDFTSIQGPGLNRGFK